MKDVAVSCDNAANLASRTLAAILMEWEGALVTASNYSIQLSGRCL
jgi:hypothetical protein